MQIYPGNESSGISSRIKVEDQEWEEFAAYDPTGHEIVQLVKYWYGRVLDDHWFYFICGQTGGSESLGAGFTQRDASVGRAEAIGKGAVDRAIQEVRDQFKAKINNQGLWETFENGTDEQWDAVRAETYRLMDEKRRGKDP